MKKLIKVFLSIFLSLTFLHSQSLVELAQKEKQRRESLGGKKGIVVTNEDLNLVKKRAAILIPLSFIPEDKDSIRIPQAQPSRRNLFSPSGPIGEIDRTGNKSSLETRLEKEIEYAELLETKINALQQKFYTFLDWTLRDEIQREIVETYEKLEETRRQIEELKKSLNKK